MRMQGGACHVLPPLTSVRGQNLPRVCGEQPGSNLTGRELLRQV